MSYPAEQLPPHSSFEGAGVYTIHYRGDFNAYHGMPDHEPIYVGKADPPGKRQGRSLLERSLSQSIKPALYDRLTKHAVSIKNASNICLSDFMCRWLVLDEVWIGLTEQVLIAEYQPLWNVVVAGFGINDPGKGRRNQRRSQWDTLHPGRSYAAHLTPRDETPDDILSAIREHRMGQRNLQG